MLAKSEAEVGRRPAGAFGGVGDDRPVTRFVERASGRDEASPRQGRQHTGQRLTSTYTVASANPICPNASAVPRLAAPSAPAKALANTKAPTINSRLRATVNSLPLSVEIASRSFEAPLEHRDQRRNLKPGLLLCEEPLCGAAAAERSKSQFAVLANELAQGAGASCPKAALRGVNAPAALIEQLNQFLHPARRRQRGDGKNGRRGRAQRAQRRAQVASGAGRNLSEIGLRDYEHVGNLHDARLQELEHVAATGLHNDDDRVGDVHNLRLRLPYADRLDHDEVKRGGQRVCRRARRPCESAEPLACGGGADQYAAICGVE